MEFKQQMLENMRNENLIKCEVPEREELLEYLRTMMLVTGRADIMYCNSFLNEAVQLLINSIFLYEQGYFDCAFYSVRQASEVFDAMLYLSNLDETELKKWNVKEKFPMDARIRSELEKMANGYAEIKAILNDYFEHHRELINSSHKIIHKQGFDTFYIGKLHNKAYHHKDTKLFVETLKYTIGIGIILFVILEPLGLALADAEISSRLNFDFFTEPIDCDYFSRFLGLEDIISRLLLSSYYKEFTEQLKDKEPMNMATCSVIRDNAWDVNSLDEIEKQLHLLNSYERYMFCILKMGIKVSNFYFQDGWGWYLTTYKSEYSRSHFGSEAFKEYLKNDARFNQTCENVYVSVVTMYDEKLFIEHNEPFSEEEIYALEILEMQSGEEYEKYLEWIKEVEDKVHE